MKFDAFISKVRGQIKNIAVVAGVNSSEYFKKTVENINEMLNIVSSVGFFTLLGNTTEKLDRLKTLITEIDAENYVPKILFPQEKGRLDTEIDHHSAQLVQLALDCLPELPKIEDAIIQSSLKKYEKEIQQLEKILRNRIYRYNYNCRHNPIFSELKKLTDPLTLYQVQLGKLEAVALPELCSNLKTILEDSLSIAGKVLSFPSRVSYFRQDEASDDQNNPDIIGKKVGAQVFDNLQNLLFKISCIIANAIGGDNTQKIQEELMRGQSPSTSILNDLIIANSDALLKDDKQALNNLLQLIENVESELGNISKVHKQQMSGYDCQKSWQYNIFHNVKELKIALETQFPDSKKK